MSNYSQEDIVISEEDPPTTDPTIFQAVPVWAFDGNRYIGEECVASDDQVLERASLLVTTDLHTTGALLESVRRTRAHREYLDDGWGDCRGSPMDWELSKHRSWGARPAVRKSTTGTPRSNALASLRSDFWLEDFNWHGNTDRDKSLDGFDTDTWLKIQCLFSLYSLRSQLTSPIVF